VTVGTANFYEPQTTLQVIAGIREFMQKHGIKDMREITGSVKMILSGMGPVSPLQTDGGKIFAGCYALFSGLAFLTSLGIIFAPAFHRFLHKFHAEEAKRDGKKAE